MHFTKFMPHLQCFNVNQHLVSLGTLLHAFLQVCLGQGWGAITSWRRSCLNTGCRWCPFVCHYSLAPGHLINTPMAHNQGWPCVICFHFLGPVGGWGWESTWFIFLNCRSAGLCIGMIYSVYFRKTLVFAVVKSTLVMFTFSQRMAQCYAVCPTRLP